MNSQITHLMDLIQTGNSITPEQTLWLYGQIDSEAENGMQIHQALVDYAKRTTDLNSATDPFTSFDIYSEPDMVFWSAQGQAFNIPNYDRGLILYLQRCVNRNYPQHTNFPELPSTRVQICDLELRLLLCQILINDVKNLAAHEYNSNFEQELKVYLFEISRAELINLYRYRIFINRLLTADKKKMLALGLTPLGLYRIISRLNEIYHEKFVFNEILPKGFEYLQCREYTSIESNWYPQKILEAIHNYCIAKGMKPDNPKYADFVGSNMLFLLQIHAKILVRTLGYNFFSDIFPFVTFEQLSTLSIEQVNLVEYMYAANRESMCSVKNFLWNINKIKDQDTLYVSFIDLLGLKRDFLLKMFGYIDRNVSEYSCMKRNIEALFDYGYLNFNLLLEISHANPEKLYNIACGYEGAALIFLFEEKRYSPAEFLALAPELRAEIDALPGKMDCGENREKFCKVREKLRALPFSREFTDKVNNGKYSHLKDKSPQELCLEVRYKILHTERSYSAAPDSKFIKDQEFIDFLQSRTPEHIKAVAALINTNQNEMLLTWIRTEAECAEMTKRCFRPQM